MVKVAVANLKGGTGKTVSAFFLAAALSDYGRTLLVDCDPKAQRCRGQKAQRRGVENLRFPSWDCLLKMCTENSKALSRTLPILSLTHRQGRLPLPAQPFSQLTQRSCRYRRLLLT